MNFINRMEQKFGRYALRDLPAIIIGLYAAGYVLSVIAPRVLAYLTLDPVYILHGQVWRLVTWIIVPPSSLDIFTVIMLFFYFSIARALVMRWGAFRFNFYFFSGMLFTVIGAFVVYAWYNLRFGQAVSLGAVFNTYYINMSIFLAFALTYPEAEVLLYFIIPVKMKWMGILYGVLIAYSFIQSGVGGRVLIIASLLNFLLFWLMTRNAGRGMNSGFYGSRGSAGRGSSRGRSPFSKGSSPFSKGHSGAKIDPSTRRNAAAGQAKPGGMGAAGGAAGRAPIHRCAICGRTELDSDQLEFRYCSKCEGAYEYCQDHLFTHTHVRSGQ